jgi:hypothetical protein
MFVTDTRSYPPLFTLPRWKRRWRLRRIIAVRRRGHTPALGWFLRLQGWQAGIPAHPERSRQLVLRTGKYSVRGYQHDIPMFRVHDWAIEEAIRRR